MTEQYIRGRVYPARPEGWITRFEAAHQLATGLAITEAEAEKRLCMGRARGFKNLLWVIAERQPWYCPNTLTHHIVKERKRIENKAIRDLMILGEWG